MVRMSKLALVAALATGAFVLGGAGYQWFRTSGAAPSALPNGMAVNTGNEVVVPLGAGLATYLGRHKRFDIDARFTYDVGTNSGLIGNTRADQWFATGNLGYVF